ncbi:MAG TPA: carboxypeptidase regulatory-like domain-containing protein [Gemmatimonadaceae bacterium]|nr:carboxypeptidase regulatory-like domain-containing protein [Gemmatimonadaceae bacterium]
MRLAVTFAALVAIALPTLSSFAPAAHAQDAVPGRVAGRVVDGASGLPLPKVRIEIVGSAIVVNSDLDGRFTIVGLAPGHYSVLARRIGSQPKQFDSVAVTSGNASVVNFSLDAIDIAAVALQSVRVETEAVTKASSDASLLAMQRRAAAVSDGISSEQMRRAPDANASEAATRVTGISVVDGKFVVARGLSERYSTTLVNGAEVASPEPAKKIVPLDIFPASLLESIVITKSATPDKPGDFSGGAVEVKTKEFPDNTVREFSISQSGNSQSTFNVLPFPQRRGVDFLGFDGSGRAPPPFPADSAFADPYVVERFAEGIRRDWKPRARTTPPNLGLSVNLGGQRPSERAALGYVASLTYSAGFERQPDRFFQFYSDPSADPNRGFVYQDHRTVVDWGAVANASLRLGTATKLGFKNLYTRNAEELYSTGEGFSVDKNGDLCTYQFQYIERDLIQTQLAGEHLLERLRASRLEWKATLSRSGRDEPDNRQLVYLRGTSSAQCALGTTNDAWFRTLVDRQTSLQADWSVPIRVLSRDATVKVGGLARAKRRAFDAKLVSFGPGRPDEIPGDLVYLPPELLFTPENIGNYLVLSVPGSLAQPYDATDDVTAAYAMVDATIMPRIRVVGGARIEDWRLDLFDGGRRRFAEDTSLRPTSRRNRDVLLSANTTVSITERLNLRLAAFQSVSRPDTRELSLDEYVDVVGSCATIGNPALERSTAKNADARLEWYPRPGELISVSGFYKAFRKPIVRVVMGRNGCTYTYQNATWARNIGAEFDLRQRLTYLPGALSRLSAGLNLTLVESRIAIDPSAGVYDPDLPLEGQSPYLANASLTYAGVSNNLMATVLVNTFGDRVVRYGFRSSGGETATQGPNIVERGRATLDAKLSRSIGRGFTMTVAGKNLTNAPVRFVQDVAAGEVTTGYAKPGTSVSVGVGYAR